MIPSLALIFHRDDSIFAEPTTASEIVNHRPREWKSWLVWTSKDFSSNDCPRKNRFRLRCIRLETRFMQRYLATTLHFITLLFAREKRRGTKTSKIVYVAMKTKICHAKKEKKEARKLFSSSRGRKEGSRIIKRIEIRVGRKKISMDTKGGREERLSEMENGQYEAGSMGIHAVIGIEPRSNGIGNDRWQTPATSVF